jgi:thioredoxin-like negative regulator of GroEL
MKPAFDKLAADYEGHASVLIADVDCTADGQSLCQAQGVSGYPTIKYFVDGEENKYQGGREYEQLKQFVEDTLEPKCSVAEQDGCTQREKDYIVKMQGKGADAIAKQLVRMEGMKSKSMKPELKAWVNARHRLLEELSQ